MHSSSLSICLMARSLALEMRMVSFYDDGGGFSSRGESFGIKLFSQVVTRLNIIVVKAADFNDSLFSM